MSEHSGQPWESFASLAQLPDDQIDLARAALLIASTEYPGLDVDHQLGVLDALAAGAAYRLGGDREPMSSVNALSEYLFDEVGFRGNEEDYYDPKNSFLNEVLDRRLGIPITLSLVCIEVGKRVGIPLVGVGLPGHFIVMHRDEQDLFIDPFYRGIMLSQEECAERIKQIAGANTPWDSRYLEPVSTREFISRLLRNLKAMYLHSQDRGRAVEMMNGLLALNPLDAPERRDRGLVLYQLRRNQEALEDLQFYLDHAPNREGTQGIHRLVSQLRNLLGS